MTHLKSFRVILYFTLIFTVSCSSQNTKEISEDFYVGLPTQPVKVLNTNGTWLVYDLHIKAPNLQNVAIYYEDELQLNYEDFNQRGDVSIGSIWLAYPENGWSSEELRHIFKYKDNSGNAKEHVFNLKIDRQYPDPITISFPLPKGVWLAEGAPGVSSYHTRALFPFNETVFDTKQDAYLYGNNPQRYAIDYAKLVDGLPYKNDGSKLEDWYCFDQPVLAAQGGTVVYAKDGIADNQTPFELDYETDINNATGNVVYIEHADGSIGNYSHLKLNSVLVKAGDVVTTGQELGRLGNSGNSFAPHLHMHVLTNQDGKQLEDYSDGLFMESQPYKFSQFTKLGTAPVGYLDIKPIYPFKPTDSEVQRNVMPAESDVIEF